MWTDPIIEEIHKVRQEHAAKFDYDLRAIARDYQKRQKLNKQKVVSFSRKNGQETLRVEIHQQQELVQA